MKDFGKLHFYLLEVLFVYNSPTENGKVRKDSSSFFNRKMCKHKKNFNNKNTFFKS